MVAQNEAASGFKDLATDWKRLTLGRQSLSVDGGQSLTYNQSKSRKQVSMEWSATNGISVLDILPARVRDHCGRWDRKTVRTG